MSNEIDYGPLTNLIGSWKGDNGNDLAPEPINGKEVNPFYETIVYEALAPIVRNARKQHLASLFYHQKVYRKSNDEEFHNQCGHWMWDAETNTIMHTLSLPRGMTVVAGGVYNGETDKDGNIVIQLKAELHDKDWPIAQSPFLRDNASTIKFTYKGIIGTDTFSYTEVTLLDIYGDKEFRHVDRSTLVRVS